MHELLDVFLLLLDLLDLLIELLVALLEASRLPLDELLELFSLLIELILNELSHRGAGHEHKAAILLQLHESRNEHVRLVVQVGFVLEADQLLVVHDTLIC